MTISQLTYRAVPYVLAVAWGLLLSIWTVFGPLGQYLHVS